MPTKKEEDEIIRKASEIKSARRRTLGRPKSITGGTSRLKSTKDSVRRRDFVIRLLDRGATDQQVIDAMMRPEQPEDGRPGGLGIAERTARDLLLYVKKIRAEEFEREHGTIVRAEQSHRLRGHISGAVADKQFGAVAALERNFARLHGTDAAPTRPRPHGERRDLISDVLAGMTDEEIAALADEEIEEDDD